MKKKKHSQQENETEEPTIEVRPPVEDKKKRSHKFEDLGLEVPTFQRVFDEEDIFGNKKKKGLIEQEEQKEIEVFPEGEVMTKDRKIINKEITDLEYELDSKATTQKFERRIKECEEKSITKDILKDRFKKQQRKRKHTEEEESIDDISLEDVDDRLASLKEKKKLWD